MAAPLTVEEFLAWTPPYDVDRWELIEGLPVARTVSSPRHGAMHARVVRLLVGHLDEHPYCRVVIEPGVQPRVRANVNVRVPDLAIICTPIEPDDKLLREPVVLVEILSPSSAADTWANVRTYMTIPTVLEILMLHTAGTRAELLRRQDDGSWPDEPTAFTADGMVMLTSIGFAVPLAAFYR